MISRKKEVRKRRCRSTRGHGHILWSSTGLRRHQPHLFLVWTSKSGWWEIPLRRFGSHPHKFKLKPWRPRRSEAVSSQQQQRTESSTAGRCLSTCGYERVALSKSLGEGKELPVAVAQWKGMDSCRCCDEGTDRQCVHRRRSVPSLAPFLAKVLTLELTPTAKW